MRLRCLLCARRFVVGCMEFDRVVGWVGLWVQSFHFAMGWVGSVVWWGGWGCVEEIRPTVNSGRNHLFYVRCVDILTRYWHQR